MTGVLILNREGREIWAQTYIGGELRVNRKAESGNSSTHQGVPKIASKPAEARRGAGIDALSQPPAGTSPAHFLFLRLLSSGTVRQSIFGKLPGQWYFVMAALASSHTYLKV